MFFLFSSPFHENRYEITESFTESGRENLSKSKIFLFHFERRLMSLPYYYSLHG